MCDNSTKELQQLAEKHEEQLKEMHELQERLTVGQVWLFRDSVTKNSSDVQRKSENVILQRLYRDLGSRKEPQRRIRQSRKRKGRITN